MIIYLQWYRPFEEKAMNKIETFNEVTIVILTYFLFCFTDFVPEAQTRHGLGAYYSGVTLLNIAVHMIIMLRHSYRSVRLYCLKRKYTKNMKSCKTKNQTQVQQEEKEVSR